MTTNWQPGETIIDNHGIFIPVDIAAGSYLIRLGMYPIDDPTARLPIITPAGVLDAWPLATITVTAR